MTPRKTTHLAEGQMLDVRASMRPRHDAAENRRAGIRVLVHGWRFNEAAA